MTFGQSLSVRTHDQANMDVVQPPKAQERPQELLAGRYRLKIDPPNHLGDPLQLVIHDNRQVVGRHTIVALQDDVVDHTLGTDRFVNSQSQCRTTYCSAFVALCRGQVAAGTGIHEEVTVRRRRRVSNLASRTEAFICDTLVSQSIQVLFVDCKTIALENNAFDRIHTDRSQVPQLSLSQLSPRRDTIKVFHPNDQSIGCEYLGRDCRPQIPEMKNPRGRGSKSPEVLRVHVVEESLHIAMAANPRQLNRRERMVLILQRDGFECVWCRATIEIGMNRATTEHLVPRIKGGPSWIENEIAACRGCNGRRGHVSPAEWLDECIRLGLDPNKTAILHQLVELNARVLRDGGCRRMRPYLDSQIRRLKR